MNTRLASVHRFRQVLNRPELRLTPVLGQPVFLSRSGDSCEYGDDRGVELPARVLAQRADGFLVAPSPAVRPVRSHCVVGVSHVYDARGDRDCFAAQTAGITAAIPVLVMKFHRRQIVLQAVYAFENPAADGGVLLDQRRLLLVELAGLL